MNANQQKKIKTKQPIKSSIQQMEQSLTYKRFSPVWAKIKGYPWWPAKILDIDVNRAKHYTVIFFPDSSIAYLNQMQIRPYKARQEKFAVPSDPKILKDWKKAKQQFNALLEQTQRQQNQSQNQEADEQNKDIISISATHRQISESQLMSNHQNKKPVRVDKKQQRQKSNEDEKSKKGTKHQQRYKSPKIQKSRSSIVPKTAYSFAFDPEEKRLVDSAKKEQEYQLKVLNKHRKGEKITVNSQKWENYCRMKERCLKVLLCKGFNRKKAVKTVGKIWVSMVQNRNKDQQEIYEILKNKSEKQIKQMTK